jgi:hypothetical protein
MPNIIGEAIPEYVEKQIAIRQQAHGSGVSGNRTPDQLTYLNSKTAWVKLASGVSVESTRMANENLRSKLSNTELAKNFVLFNGMSRLSGGNLDPRGNSPGKNNIYDWFDGTYNITAAKYTEYSGEMGLVPMPGIVDASIKCENRGSIRKATVNIKCYSPEQFKILDLLYLRIGYTMLLEWGWYPYLTNSGGLSSDYFTLTESSFFGSNEQSHQEFLKKIEAYREGKNGNYDGLLCRVTNFSWNFNQDGTYDVQLNLISLGDVIESLKVNLSPTKAITDYIIEAYKLYGNEEIDEEELEKNPPSPATNIISAYFFIQRIYLTENSENDSYWTMNDVLSKTSVKTIPVATKKIIPPTNKIIESNQTNNDFLYFSYNTLVDDENTLNDEGFYVRFGHLLEFVKDNCIFKVKKDFKNIIDIDFDTDSNRMYTFPYQVSLDPRVCIVKNTVETIKTKEYYNNIPDWKNTNVSEPYGKIMNIYLNCNMVNRIISEKQDDKGNISLFELLESICSEVNKALGNLNNLEVSVDETSNTIKIIDASYTPTVPVKTQALELYGYSGSSSNFVYDFNIKTEITNDFATMASVGATAGGYVKGTENTMFSKWNRGIIDRFKKEYVPPAISESKSNEIQKEPPLVYVEEFWNKQYAPFGLTPPQDIENDIFTGDACALSPEIIDKNLTIVDEFYKYCNYRIQVENEKYASPSIGFIPISLGITLEGISGIKIYNYIEVSTRMLPANYPDSLKFIIKGVNHKIADGKWETGIETVSIPNIFDANGKPTPSYSDIKTIVRKVIKEGEDLSKSNDLETKETPPTVKAAEETSALLATATSSGSGTSVQGVGGTGKKTLGTAGQKAESKDLSEDALSKEAIEKLVNESDARELAAIRARIVRIAASYIGQFESLPAQNPGWWDPDFEAKFKSNPKLQLMNWSKGAPWCAWFCQVVWKEAYNTGNKYTGNWEYAPQFKDQYKTIWDTTLKDGAIIGAYTPTLRKNFQSIKKFITLNDALTGRSLPEPGDIAVYGKSGLGTEYHVDIVVKPFVTNGKLTGFSSIGGNTGKGDLANGGETKYYPVQYDWKKVVGFCKVVTISNQNTDYASSPPGNSTTNSTISNESYRKYEVIKKYENQVLIKGSYYVPEGTPSKGDALHSFERRKSDGFGGRMKTIINKEMIKIYKKGKNPDIWGIKIQVDSKNYKVNWEATVGVGGTNKAYVGIATVGSAGSGADERAAGQIPTMKTWVAGAKNYTLSLDFKNPTGIYIRQYFYKYTIPSKYPAYK